MTVIVWTRTAAFETIQSVSRQATWGGHTSLQGAGTCKGSQRSNARLEKNGDGREMGTNGAMENKA